MYRLVGLTNLLVPDVSSKLTALVAGNKDRLAAAFPETVKNYATDFMAGSRLYFLQEEMGLAAGRYGSYVVYWCDEVAGMVTYSMYTTWFLVPGKGFAWIHGPLIAGWLDRHRPGSAKRKGADVLRLLAHEIAKEDVVTGKPWSVVRPGNLAAERALGSVDNGFGGLMPVGGSRNYSAIDRVTAPRQLYVGNYRVEALAAHSQE